MACALITTVTWVHRLLWSPCWTLSKARNGGKASPVWQSRWGVWAPATGPIWQPSSTCLPTPKGALPFSKQEQHCCCRACAACLLRSDQRCVQSPHADDVPLLVTAVAGHFFRFFGIALGKYLQLTCLSSACVLCCSICMATTRHDRVPKWQKTVSDPHGLT